MLNWRVRIFNFLLNNIYFIQFGITLLIIGIDIDDIYTLNCIVNLKSMFLHITDIDGIVKHYVRQQFLTLKIFSSILD